MVEQRKYDFVDALRGVAVLLVILSHTEVPVALIPLNVIGQYGVQLFFVVSAFTLFLSMEAKYSSDRHPLLYFSIRRVFRIAPAFYLAAIFYLLVNGVGESRWAPTGIHFWQIAATFLFMHGWHPEAINAVVPGGWSIAVEMTFYLFLPLCFVYITTIYRAVFLSFALLAIGVVIRQLLMPGLVAAYPEYNGVLAAYFLQLWFISQACVFPLGFVLYFLFRDFRRPRTIIKKVAVGLFIVSSCLLGALTRNSNPALPPFFLYSIVFVIIAYLFAVQPFRLFVNPFLCHIGKVSFSVYLVHFWVIHFVEVHILPALPLANSYLRAVMMYGCTTLISVIIATITYRLIELPGEEIGRRLIKGIDVRGRPLAPAD